MYTNKNNIILIIGVAAAILISSCGNSIKTSSESERVNTYLDRMFDEYLDRHPEYQAYLGIKKDYDRWDDISPAAETAELIQAKISLQWLEDSVDTKLLDDQTLLSFKLYKKKLEDQIDDHRYRLYNYPVNQMSGKQSGVPAFLINMHKITSKKDALDYIARLNGIRPLFDQLIKNIIERESAGIIAPNYVFDHVLNDSKNVITGIPLIGRDSCALFLDFHDKIMKLEISSSEKDELLGRSKQAILTKVKPAYDRLIDLVKTLMNTHDEEDGVWRLEDGVAFFEYAL